MRAASLLPFAFIAALAAACGSEMPGPPELQETAGRPAPPERDLTLQTAAPTVREVASPVELARPKPAERPSRVARLRHRPKPAPPPPAETDSQPAAPILVPVPVASTPLQRAAEPDAAVTGRELAPGKTVTVIPVSNEPGIEADEDDAWLPSERPRGIGRGGGTCRKPGAGVRRGGITGRIPVGIPVPHLR